MGIYGHIGWSEWVRLVVEALADTLCWESIGLLGDLVRSGALEGSETVTVGANDGYNLTLTFTPATSRMRDDQRVEGGCGYGSSVFVAADGLRVASCGGHWVEARRIGDDDLVRFVTDRAQSVYSWGEQLDCFGCEEETCAGCVRAAAGAQLEARRVSDLEKAFKARLRELTTEAA